MAKHLDDLLAKLREVAADADDAADQRRTIIAAAVAEDDVDLADLAEGVRQKSTAVNPDDEITDEQVEYLGTLAEVSEGINDRAEQIEQARAAEARKATAAALAEKIKATRAPDAEPAPAATPAAPAASGDGDGGGAPAGDGAGTDTAAVVAASGGSKPKGRTPLGGVRPNTDRAGARKVHEGTVLPANQGIQPERYSMVASSDIPGFFSGQELPSMGALVSAAAAKFQSLSRHGQGGGRAGIATFNRTVDPRTLIENEMADWHKLDDVANERLLPGGSLVAALQGQASGTLTASTPAPGLGVQAAPDVTGFGYAWCSPMEIINQLCPLEATLEGMVDLPTITTTKGGVMWPHTPDYADLFKDTPFCFTQADMGGAAFEKPCVEIPCADGWDQCILDACSFCIIDNILLSRVDDSQIQRAIAQGLNIYRRGLNAKRIKKMLDLTTADSGGSTVISVDQLRAHGPGLFESILSFLELQVEHLRARKRLARNTTFEGIAPVWLRAVLRADLSKKNAIQDRWSVTDADVDRWLAARGIRLQYVWEFQDAGVDPTSPIGGDVVPTQWPGSVQILLYQAGSFTAIQGPSVQLDAVYDRANLQKNKRVRMFIEDMWCLTSRCGLKYLYDIPLCPNGVSGGQEVIECTPPTPPNPPAAATAVAVENPTANTLDVTWEWAKGTGATDGDATGFEVRYRTPAGSGTWSAPRSVSASARTATLSGLTAGTEYEVEVVATGGGGTKSAAATATGSTTAAEPAALRASSNKK
ncbi:major capsid protein [Streptomyces sp. NPDC049879]|uniref:major capsid protein n=1 Tax=Streptomyces sp. NPDC049879 TaxID=3365598 RepID=UPI0037BD69F4